MNKDAADPVIDREASIAEFDAAKPQRKLSVWPNRIVQVMAATLALLGLWCVVNPISKQMYQARRRRQG